MSTLNTLSSAQISRAISMPEQAIAPNPARETLLESFRQRNAVLDAVFYDVGTLSEDEGNQLAPHYAAEGAILIVGPTSAGTLAVSSSTDDFLSKAPEALSTLVVAGVGSSALGAAAFARNVADALDAPVAAVVSGYGLADLLNEAMGGFFLFGYLNSLRHVFEPVDDLFRPRGFSGSSSSTGVGQLAEVARSSLDVRRIYELLSSDQRFDLLIGHSKGNLVLSEALYALRESDPTQLVVRGKDAHVVTISAKVAMPAEMTRVTDVMGRLDAFGAMNSRPTIATDFIVTSAWHHTNTELPFHLPVTDTLAQVLEA